MKLKSFILRCRFLRAYALDLESRSGPLSSRKELTMMFNAQRFWFQQKRSIPEK